VGNLDDDIRGFLRPGERLVIPFFAFALGANLNLAVFAQVHLLIARRAAGGDDRHSSATIARSQGASRSSAPRVTDAPESTSRPLAYGYRSSLRLTRVVQIEVERLAAAAPAVPHPHPAGAAPGRGR
jgi:hypothetical protein